MGPARRHAELASAWAAGANAPALGSVMYGCGTRAALALYAYHQGTTWSEPFIAAVAQLPGYALGLSAHDAFRPVVAEAERVLHPG